MVPLGYIRFRDEGFRSLKVRADIIQVLHIDQIPFGFKCLQQLNLMVMIDPATETVAAITILNTAI